MGTLYYVVCDDCKVARDLDKFYDLNRDPQNRAQMLKESEDVGRFRAALLVTFMGKHMGHNCRVLSETDFEFYIESDEVRDGEIVLKNGYVKDVDYWSD